MTQSGNTANPGTCLHDALVSALTAPLRAMLETRFPEWALDGGGYRYVEFIDRIAGIAAEAGLVPAPPAWVADYDPLSPVDKSKFPDPSIGNCPGCSNVIWHARLCPVAERTRVTSPVEGRDS